MTINGIHFSVDEFNATDGKNWMACRVDRDGDYIGTIGWYKTEKTAINACNRYAAKRG